MMIADEIADVQPENRGASAAKESQAKHIIWSKSEKNMLLRFIIIKSFHVYF